VVGVGVDLFTASICCCCCCCILCCGCPKVVNADTQRLGELAQSGPSTTGEAPPPLDCGGCRRRRGEVGPPPPLWYDVGVVDRCRWGRRSGGGGGRAEYTDEQLPPTPPPTRLL
jgi:hypothetical protein